MSKDPASSSRNPQPLESNENRFESSSNNPTHVQFHPRRSPLNAIPDPSQLRRDLESDSDAPKLDGAEGSQTFDDKTSVSSSEGLLPVGKFVSVLGLGTSTPKVTSGRARVNSESNSAQSTPARSSGIRGLGAGSRIYQSNGGRTGGSSRVSRRFTIVNTEHAEPVVDAPHFELEEDPLFWKDHNVQVLIRVRPLNNMERVLQGSARCLKQESAHTLVWLGHPETRYTFDHIVCETITQEKLFRVAGLPMVENCMSGYNSCIFAYGQTGSGKTYTMMGEIHENEGKLNQDCGITPRIFEYLFRRIKAEEESRRDEKLTYNCKCSFLEIYNEQTTDLLEPSSTNLQLREDFKKGVYVENLTEHNVRTVNDVLQLLIKGAANRKSAATHMNSESSRSHSVFTCIIESRWEKDSMIHSRYGRLNLVDLAGSERQKSSGAEGDRLKEAANINKSLSTLGLVIMSLVDVAHGKQRHVPYRDSRLTFLLQDSLGGNSKTTIIANVSPSFCSATETLSTLKFAQRAKLIQNNAKVNEDASGDVTALQEQVQQLKDQLSHLLNNQGQSTDQLHNHGNTQLSLGDFQGKFEPSVDGNNVYKQELRNANEKIKCLESALACSFKREKMAQTAIKKLEAELESKSPLVTESSLRLWEMKQADTISMGDTVSIRSDFGYDTSSNLAEDEIQHEKIDYQMDGMTSMKSTVVAKELSDARLLVEALECEHIRLMQELQLMEERNQQLLDVLGQENMQKNLLMSSHKTPTEMQIPNNQNKSLMNEDSRSLALQAKLEKMTRDLEEARSWNKQYQDNEALKLHHQKDVELVREQVEVETAITIIHLQEEIAMLQAELHKRLSIMDAENNQLRNVIADKEDQLHDLSSHWEKATLELTSFLMDGSKSLNYASSRIRSMASLFPHVNGSLGERIESAARACMEKEELILLLQKSLEDAQKMVFEMKQKLNSLKGVAIALTESQHLVSTGCSGELYDASINNIETMNYKLDHLWNMVNEVFEDPEASLSKVKSPSHSSSLEHDFDKLPQMAGSTECVSQLNTDPEAQAHESAIGESGVLVNSIRLRLQEFEGEALASYEDSEKHLFDFQHDILEASAVSNELVESVGKDLHASSGDFEHLKGKCKILQFSSSEMPVCEPSKDPKPNELQMMDCIREGLAETNSRLGLIQASVDKLLEAYADKWETDSSTSDSSLSCTSASAGEKGPSSGSATENGLGQFCEHAGSCQKMNTLLERQHEVEGSMLIEELEMVSRAFRNLCASLTSLVTQTDLAIKPHKESNQSLAFVVNNNLYQHTSVNKKHRISEMTCLPQCPNTGTEGAYSNSSCSNKIFAPDSKIEQNSCFLSNFEEAYSTMKEADLMLNKLVKSNENAKELTHMWKQVCKELKGERDCLLDQVQQLKSKLSSKKSEDDTLDNEKSNLIEVTNSVFSLVDFFSDMQKDLEELCKGVYSDLLSMSKEVHNYVGSLRDLFEQKCAEFIEKDFSSLVVHACIGNSLSRMQDLSAQREQTSPVNEANSAAVNCGTLSREHGNKIAALPMLEIEESFPQLGNLSQENLQLRRELERKEGVLKGLLFDFSLLQETTSNSKDIKDEINKLIMALGQAEFELQVKRHEVNSLMLQVREMEESLAKTKHLLAISNSELEQTQRSLDSLSEDNHELRLFINDLHCKKSEAEKQLDEQDEIIKGLEKEIFHLTSSASERVFQSIENVEDDLLRVTAERDELCAEIRSLKEKMEMASALAEENEALVLEARQDSVASKIYTEQKEEEVKILENSIEELEDTVNVLEKKVEEMDEEVQKHRLDRNSLETEIQALRQRMLTVENLTENMDQEDSLHEKLENHIPRRFKNQFPDLDQACAKIKVLEKIKAEQAKEIDRMKEYVSELVLLAEAQASQYQERYKNLEAMVCELKKNPSSIVSVTPVLEKRERSSSRPRGSSSPFRCISNLVHQMNDEKDQKLSIAKARIEDLEVLAASRQKEVCMLSSRLAAAESMTHDIIRDLLGLKLDMTNYANLVDEHQLHSLLDAAHQKTVESKRREEEIHKLRMQIRDLIDERDSCFNEINQREANTRATQLTVEQLKERDQYLTVQNELLKVEKSNLMHRLVQVESMVKDLEQQKGQRHLEHPIKIKENLTRRDHSSTRRILHTEENPHVNNELARYRRFAACSNREQKN